MKVVPLGLQPGADLRQALEAWMGEQQEQAGCVISAVGSCRWPDGVHQRGDRPQHLQAQPPALGAAPLSCSG